MDAEAIRNIVAVMVILIASITFHEFGHAIVADKLGDRLPRSQGRVNLNPTSHADPFGTLLFPMVFLILSKGQSIGFGWGRPVQVNPLSFTRKFRMRTSHMLVALAGPMMNIVLAFLVLVIYTALVKWADLSMAAHWHRFFRMAVAINFMLFFFNLIPAQPLDGGAVVKGLLPDRLIPGYERFEVYGPFVLLGVIMIPGISDIFVRPALWATANAYKLFGLF